MNNSMKNRSMIRTGKMVSALIIAMATLFFWTPAAFANTAAGTAITNAVTVDYDDAGGAAQLQISDSVDVTVSLVGALSWGAVPSDGTANSGASLPTAYTTTLTNLGNGSDTFTITDGTTQNPAQLSAGTFTIAPDEDGGTAGTQITLFGTVTSGTASFGGGTTTIPVSNLVTGDLTAGTTQVVISGGGTYTVAAGSTATQLVVTGDATGDILGAGVQIGEIATITFDGTVGTITVVASSDHTHNMTATGTSQNGNPAATAALGAWTTTVNGAALTVDKYVRNVTNASGNPVAGSVSINGQNYWASGVTGNPDTGSGGDTLEYVIVVNNTAAGLATAVLVEDTLPAYTTLVAGSVEVDTDGIGGYDVTGESEAHDDGGGIVETDTGDAATATQLSVYAGVGGDETVPALYGGTGGNIAGSGSCVIRYQVTID